MNRRTSVALPGLAARTATMRPWAAGSSGSTYAKLPAAGLSDRSVADAADRVSNRIHAALAGREEAGEGASRGGHANQPGGPFRHVRI